MKGTLNERVIFSAASPMELLCQTENASCFSVRHRYKKGSDGVVNTMQVLLMHDIMLWVSYFAFVCLSVSLSVCKITKKY